MSRKISKKERGELASAGTRLAEKACTDETDVATANEVIEYPEEWAAFWYKAHIGRDYIADLDGFKVFKTAFVDWVRSTYDAEKV